MRSLSLKNKPSKKLLFKRLVLLLITYKNVSCELFIALNNLDYQTFVSTISVEYDKFIKKR